MSDVICGCCDEYESGLCSCFYKDLDRRFKEIEDRLILLEKNAKVPPPGDRENG